MYSDRCFGNVIYPCDPVQVPLSGRKAITVSASTYSLVILEDNSLWTWSLAKKTNTEAMGLGLDTQLSDNGDSVVSTNSRCSGTKFVNAQAFEDGGAALDQSGKCGSGVKFSRCLYVTKIM